MNFSFSQFSHFLQQNLETNDTSFESPKIALLESGEELGMAWHCPGAGHAHLIKKATLLLEFVWSLSGQRFARFSTCFQTVGYRAFF